MSTLYENYTTGGNGWEPITTAFWRAQTFTASASYSISSVKLFLYRSGYITLTVGLHAVDGSHKPTGSALATGTISWVAVTTDTDGEWSEAIFDTPYALTNGVEYAIVCSSNGSTFYVRRDSTSPSYAGGAECWSTNGGSSWTVDSTKDILFENYGDASPTYVDASAAVSVSTGVTAAATVKTYIDATASVSVTIGITASPSAARTVSSTISVSTNVYVHAGTIQPQDYYHLTGASTYGTAQGVNWLAMVFKASASYSMASVGLKLAKTGSPGTVTVSLRASDGSVPTGGDLASGTIDGDGLGGYAAWENIEFSSSYSVTEDNYYAIVIRAPSGDSSNKAIWAADSTFLRYTNGQYCSSSNSGSSWTPYASSELLFETFASEYADAMAAISVTIGVAASPSVVRTATASVSISTGVTASPSAARTVSSTVSVSTGVTAAATVKTHIDATASVSVLTGITASPSTARTVSSTISVSTGVTAAATVKTYIDATASVSVTIGITTAATGVVWRKVVCWYDTPTLDDLTLSSPSNIYSLSHDSFTDFTADEHFLQTAITNVSSGLATGILKVTTGTGALSVTTDNTSNWDAAYSHISATGASHSYINQSVTTAATPEFARLGIGGPAHADAKLNISVDGYTVDSSLISQDSVIVGRQAAVGAALIVADDGAYSRGVFKGTRAGGTLETPTVPSENDYVLSIGGAIYDGVDTEATGLIDFFVDGAVSENTCPQRISFSTSETNALGRVERLLIKSNGEIRMADLTASRLCYSNADKAVKSVSDLTSWVAGTANRVTVADDGDGSITLSAPQDIHTAATPTFDDLTLSSPSNIYSLSHDSFTDFTADEHFLQTAITNVSSGLATGILKVTTGTGALSVTTDNTSNWDAAYSHISATGASHSYIDQSVTTADTVQFAKVGIGVSPVSSLHIQSDTQEGQQFTFNSASTPSVKGRLGHIDNGGTVGNLLSTGGVWSVSGSTFSATKDLANRPTAVLFLGNVWSNASICRLAFLKKDQGSTTTDGDVTELFAVDTSGNTVVTGTLTVNGDQTGATDSVFDEYDDIQLLKDWRAGKKLPFEGGDILNRDRLLRDSIIQQNERLDQMAREVKALLALLQ